VVRGVAKGGPGRPGTPQSNSTKIINIKRLRTVSTRNAIDTT